MTECIKITLQVAGKEPGQTIPNVTAYLPFEGAMFAAQQHVDQKGLWMIVRVPTTGLLPGGVASFSTRADALVVAGRLSREVPAAAHVKVDDKHVFSGPFAEMRDQIIASIKAAA